MAEGAPAKLPQDLTYTRPAHRVHLSGDPEKGWIGEIHDDSEHVAWQSGGTNAKPEDHPDTAMAALDALHAFYEKVKGKAVDEWASLRNAFLTQWNATHGDPSEPPGAPKREGKEDIKF